MPIFCRIGKNIVDYAKNIVILEIIGKINYKKSEEVISKWRVLRKHC